MNYLCFATLVKIVDAMGLEIVFPKGKVSDVLEFATSRNCLPFKGIKVKEPLVDGDIMRLATNPGSRSTT